MRIEEITKESLEKISKSELYNLRFRCVQLYQKHFRGNRIQKIELDSGDLVRNDFYKQYNLVIHAMKDRNLISNVSELDRAIFKREMLGIDVKSLGDLELIKDYIAIGGTFVENPREAKEIKIIIRKREEDRDEDLELQIEQLLKRETGKDVRFIYEPEGPDGFYIPLFALNLKVKSETIRIEKKKKPIKKVINVSKKLTASQRLECDLETEKIKANKQKAKFPHKFKAAKYTHPNGHPRCIQCGQEEMTGGICEFEKIEKGVIGYKDYGAAPEETPWTDETAAAERKKATVEDLKKYCAWYDSEDPDLKTSYKMLHHRISDGKAIWKAVYSRMAILMGARGGVDIPDKDRKTVYNHLVKHYAHWDKEAPEFKKHEMEELEKAFGKTYEEDVKINKVIEEGEEIDIKKPFPNEHSARLQDPGRYDQWSRTKNGYLYGKRIKVPADVSIIWGHPKGQKPKIWVPQSLRFPKDAWNVARAKKWLSDNNVSYKLFEAAKGTMKKSTINIPKPIDGKIMLTIMDVPEKRVKEMRRDLAGKIYNNIELPGDVNAVYIKTHGSDHWNLKAIEFPADNWNKIKIKDWLEKYGLIHLVTRYDDEKSMMKFEFLKIEKKKQIVGGIVYAPDIEDAQGDYTDAKEIEKAMYLFMEKYALNTKKIKVMHKGRTLHFPILECFQPDEDIMKGGQAIPAGSWWLMIKIDDKEVWDDIDQGKLTGFSMGGRAKHEH